MLAQLDSLYIKTRPLKALVRLISYALFEGRPLTTRGRWINPLVFALFALQKRLPQLKKVERPIFVLGMGRSGTTVLGKVLSMHRDVGLLNEPKALWYSVHQGEDVIGNYTMAEARFRLPESEATSDVKKKARKFYGAYLAVTGTSRVVDKYMDVVFRIPFIKAIFPDALFVVLVRNGWDVCHSVDGWSKRYGSVGEEGSQEGVGDSVDWWGRGNRKWNYIVDELVAGDEAFDGLVEEIRCFDSQKDMAAVEWIVTMRESLRVIREYSESTHLVKYEAMTENPRETLKAICDFCGLSRDEKFLNYGDTIISKTPPKESFDLHPSIRPLFEETMASLGYI